MANKKRNQKRQQAAAATAANAAQATGNGTEADESHDEEIQVESQDTPSPESEPTPAPEPIDPLKEAEKKKEAGNAAFRTKNYQEAIERYTEAIDFNSNEPTYLTNRAAAYMALKKFKPALADCQQAANLQSDAPSVKTLTRLARCQLSTGSTAPALSTLRSALSIEPKNDAALQLQKKVLEIEAHLRNFEGARGRKDWGHARLALDKCVQGIEAEGGDIPLQWRLWRIDLELARANWDAASIAANDAMRLEPNSPDVLTSRGLVMFLTAKTAQALKHVVSALQLDPGHEPAMRLRKRVKDVDRLKDEGNVAFKAGKLQTANEKYTEALERIGCEETEGKGGHIRAMLLSNRATTLLKLGLHDDALVDVEESISLNDLSFKVYRTRARIYLHMEKYDAAIADFKTAIEQAESEGNDGDVKALKVDLKKAEADLKRSKTKDYYKILGISRECTEIEIKKAYRKESLKHHPDKGGDEEKFKLIVEAHGVLSDPQKRRRYDLGEDDDEGQGIDLADLFGGRGGFPPGFAFSGGAGGFGGFGGGGYGGGGFGGHSHGRPQGFPF
ncbi:hypothetical protein BDY19DRAFT_944755 [Irpex rosettiformis]|uniref:Uncharacterized protein n=1 Tax=Irpex rosettiformis TaxID=378272 RepID=A0ACB8U4I5_9APHY|nr:hypothetical protein BDY19DRAFT_944755 [Irpex rosettiformis]